MTSPERCNVSQITADLGAVLEARRIETGSKLLGETLPVLLKMNFETEGIGSAVGALARWVDVGVDDGGALEQILKRLDSARLLRLPLAEYVEVRLAQAALASAREDTQRCLRHLEFILAIAGDLADRKPVAIANFWKARCLRKAGEYDSALQYAQKARDLAIETGMTMLAAVIQSQESWLLFQKGNTKEAIRVLQEAEAVLKDSDDFITLGNIQSAYGRIARREGRYEHAIQYFEASLDLFRHRPSLEGHYARSLANIAKAKRLLAAEWRRRIEEGMEERQRSRAGVTPEESAGKARDLERMRLLLEQAQKELAEASEIYARFPSHHGSGNVQIGFSEIYLDLGHFDEAEGAATRAFELGAATTDYLLMARARMAQAMVANARYEDQIAERDEPGRFAQLAYDCAREAVAFAEHTQSRRILARAYTCQGVVLMNGFFNNSEAARKSADRAEEYLGSDRHGSLWHDLQLLRGALLRESRLDPNLRAWSEGEVDGKSLQAVVEEFESFLIAKVWQREDKKVSRVAQRLSVSPKKVRRLLRRQGLVAEREDHE